MTQNDQALDQVDWVEGEAVHDDGYDDPTICEACGDWTPCDCDIQLMAEISEDDGGDEENKEVPNG